MPTRSKSGHRSNSSSNREDASVPDQGDPQEGSAETVESSEKHAVGSFLRGLALRAEADASFAGHIQSALEESGLLGSLGSSDAVEAHQPVSQKSDTPSEKSSGKSASNKASKPTAALDPFQLLREEGIIALRETLEKIDLEELHAIVRKYRLDPARISSRWTRKERVIDLIVDQVTANARHGQAFSHL